MTVIPVVIGALGTVTDAETERLRSKRTSGDHSNYNIVEIGQNTKKSSGHLCKNLSKE